MNRPPELSRWLVRGAASATALLLITILAPAAAAQGSASAKKATASVGQNEKGEEDDDLLEPSNTGYVDDAVVGSKLRLRYDAATGATRPDRAELIYGKCTCFRTLFGQDAASPGPAENLDFQELELTWEQAFGRRFSLFVEVPFRWIDLTIPEGLVPALGLGPNVRHSGLGDVRAGIKYAPIARARRYLTLQARTYFDSGDAEQALGTGHASIELGLLHFERLSRRLTFSSELRWWHPLSGSSDPLTGATGRIEGFPELRGELGGKLSPDPPDPAVRNDGYAGDVLRFGLGVSREGRGPGITVSPVAELVGWLVLDGYSFNAADGLQAVDNDTILNLKLGARIGGRGPGSIFLGYGFPLTGEDWYDGVFRLEYRLPLAGLG